MNPADSCKNATTKDESYLQTSDHDKIAVEVESTKFSQLIKKIGAFVLENDRENASNRGQSPSSATNSDKRNVPREKSKNESSAEIENLRKKVQELEEIVAEFQRKFKHNEQSNNDLSAEKENMQKKMQELEKNLAQFQKQLKKLSFEKNQLCNNTISRNTTKSEIDVIQIDDEQTVIKQEFGQTSQDALLESEWLQLEQNHNEPTINQTSPENVPDSADDRMLSDCQQTFLPVINEQSDNRPSTSQDSLLESDWLELEQNHNEPTINQTSPENPADDPMLTDCQQTFLHVINEQSDNRPSTSQNIAMESARPELEQNHNPPAIAETLSEAIPDHTDHSAVTHCQPTILPVVNQQYDLSEESIDALNDELSHLNRESSNKRATDDNESEYRLESGTEETYTNNDRAHDSSKVNQRESKVQRNSRPKLNKKRQINQFDVGSKCAVNGEKRVPRAKAIQKRYFDGEHKCKLCRYATNIKPNLARHMRAHMGEKPYKCQMCNYASTQPGTLKEHERIHSGERPYKCRFCEYATGNHGSLFLHERTHSGEKPHKCQLCNYATTRNSTLIKHILIHTGEKPYKYRLCQFASSRSSRLNQHMRTQHKSTLKLYTADSKNIAKQNMLKNSAKKD